MSQRRRRTRATIIAFGSIVALTVVALAGVAVVQQRRRARVDRVVARACRLPTDAAGRRYLRRADVAARIDYIETISAMYRRCPRRAERRARPVASTAPVVTRPVPPRPGPTGAHRSGVRGSRRSGRTDSGEGDSGEGGEGDD
jgi:hypothetical protein